MEDVDVQKLSRKELIQLCADHNIRTAGIKHDDLIRLLQKKLHPPASDPPRVMPKARSQISTNSPVSSPKARHQTRANPPFSSPSAKGKPAERASLPTPASTSQGRSLSPLALVEGRSRNNPPEPSPRTPGKDQLSPNPGVLPRKPTPTKSNAPPAQRSDLLRKKVNTLTAIGKLQAQEIRARPAQQSDGSPVRGRNNVLSAPIGKQPQATRPQQSDRGSSIRSRSGTAIGAPKRDVKSTSVPVKRPGERTVDVKNNDASRKGQSSNPTAAYSEAAASSPRASEGEASGAAIAGSQSDLGSHSFGSVSEIATDAGHHAMRDDSDADDAQSVSSEPVSRFAPQSERFHSRRTSAGSKLGRVGYPSREGAQCRRGSLDSSVESNAPLGRDSDLFSAGRGAEENVISSCSLEDDTAFNLVGDAHGLEINSFLDAHSGVLEDVIAAEGSHEIEKLWQVRAPESISMPGSQENDSIAMSEKSVREQDAVSETALSTMQKDDHLSDSGNPRVEHDPPTSDSRQEESSVPAVESNAPVAEQEDAATPAGSLEQEIEANDIPVASPRNVTDAIEAEGGEVLTSKENVEEDKRFDSTLNLVHDEDSSEQGTRSQASAGKNIQLVTERSATCSPSYQESSYDSGERLAEENDPMCCSGKDYTITSTAECIEKVHLNIDSAPLPHPEMERSSVTAMSVNRPDSSPTLESTAGDLDLCAGKSSFPCDELQQNFDTKLRGGQSGSNCGPEHDFSKDGGTKSNLLQADRSEKVPLLQDGRENESTHLTRRTLPSSILLWCSQLFSAIFGTRSQH